jgi:hypothetical protein
VFCFYGWLFCSAVLGSGFYGKALTPEVIDLILAGSR